MKKIREETTSRKQQITITTKCFEHNQEQTKTNGEKDANTIRGNGMGIARNHKTATTTTTTKPS